MYTVHSPELIRRAEGEVIEMDLEEVQVLSWRKGGLRGGGGGMWEGGGARWGGGGGDGNT